MNKQIINTRLYKVGSNKILMGDAVSQMRNHIATDSIDMVAIDPPFQTGRDFKFKMDEDERPAYSDSRDVEDLDRDFKTLICEIQRILKPGGIISIHFDWRLLYLIPKIMKDIFGEQNFVNFIIWEYAGGGNKGKTSCSRNTDYLLVYSNGSNYTFNQILINKYIDQYQRDESGRPFTHSRIGDYSEESIEKLQDDNKIYETSSGKIRKIYYLNEDKNGVYKKIPLGDVWNDIPRLDQTSQKTRTGYDTEKPVELYERLIKIFSNKNDVILDCFCGSGTTLLAAKNLGRRYIGIDKNPDACILSYRRLKGVKEQSILYERYKMNPSREEMFNIINLSYKGDKNLTLKDLDGISGYDIETWINDMMGAEHTQRSGDGGVDGKLYSADGEIIIIQSKSSKSGLQTENVRELVGAMESHLASIGILVGREYSGELVKYIENSYPDKKIILLKLKDILDYKFYDILTQYGYDYKEKIIVKNKLEDYY